MRYIIIENYQSDWPTIVTSSMTSNMPMIFTSLESAHEASNFYTDTIVVPLSKELMVWEDNPDVSPEWDDETKWPPKSDTTVYL